MKHLWPLMREYIAAEIKLFAQRQQLEEAAKYCNPQTVKFKALSESIAKLEEQSTRMDTAILELTDEWLPTLPTEIQ